MRKFVVDRFPSGGRQGGRNPISRPNLDRLGRWVEDKIDWLMEEGEDWQEPWQEKTKERLNGSSMQHQRRRLEAVSRRPAIAKPRDGRERDGNPKPTLAEDDWPSDDTFSVPRWQRATSSPAVNPSAKDSPKGPGPGSSRPLPRSSRRR